MKAAGSSAERQGRQSAFAALVDIAQRVTLVTSLHGSFAQY
jgi:hypothetical protein